MRIMQVVGSATVDYLAVSSPDFNSNRPAGIDLDLSFVDTYIYI